MNPVEHIWTILDCVKMEKFRKNQEATKKTFLYVNKHTQKTNIKLNYQNRLNTTTLTGEPCKIGKDKIIHTVWEIEKKNWTIFTILIVNSMASHFYNLLQSSKVFDEIWTRFFWDFFPFFNGYTF